MCLPRAGGCPPALLCGADRQEEPVQRGGYRSGALGMEQANAVLGLHSGLVRCSPSINRPKNPLGQNVSRVGASAGWSGEWEQTEYLDELGVWGVFGRGSALRESWGFYVLNTKFPLEAEGCERVAQPTAAY